MIHKFMLEKAPEESYIIAGKQITIRRDDKAFLPPLPPNAKMSALHAIVERAAKQGYKEVVMFAKKQQGISYATGLPVFCHEFNLVPIITYPQSHLKAPMPELMPHWLIDLKIAYPYTMTKRLHPNMVTINVNQSKKFAEERGAYFIPFGFDDALSVETHADKFALPDKVGTLVLATMTGMILAGTLKQIETRNYKVGKLIAVSCGRPIESVYKSMNKYIAELYEYGNQLDYLDIINPYDRNFDALETIMAYNAAFQGNRILPAYFHPDYEAKAWLWLLMNIDSLQEPIYFINVGR